jgi:hypothetical protein
MFIKRKLYMPSADRMSLGHHIVLPALKILIDKKQVAAVISSHRQSLITRSREGVLIAIIILE